MLRTANLPPVSDQTRNLARRLRREMTSAERKLWTRLRRGSMGAKFRRQEPIGHYVCDFYCKEAKLIVELDGGGHYHNDQAARDEGRTEFLAGLGFKVIRFSDSDVMRNPEGVLTVIWECLQERGGNQE